MQYGILERDTVSITARVITVRLERTSAVRTLPGNRPPKLVARATARAKVIMNALLFSNLIADMLRASAVFVI